MPIIEVVIILNFEWKKNQSQFAATPAEIRCSVSAKKADSHFFSLIWKLKFEGFQVKYSPTSTSHLKRKNLSSFFVFIC